MRIRQRSVLHASLAMLLTSMISCTENSSAKSTDAQSEALASNVLDDGTESEVGPVKISGVIKGGNNGMVYLQLVKSRDVVAIDTITAGSNGEYSFEYNADVIQFYRIGINAQNSFYLILAPGESAIVDADASNLFRTHELAEGPEESYRMKELNGITSKADSINLVMQAAQMNKDQSVLQSAMLEYERISARLQREVKAFIQSKPGSMASLAALQNLNFDSEFQYYLDVITALDGTADGNEIYDNMKKQVLQMRKLAIGAVAPEIEMAQPNGATLSLSELASENKYVLVDFWASWCGPCRRENPNVKRIYEKYHQKGLEILGVSLDRAKQPWLNAIGQDGLEWRHVSDLKYWQSVVVPEYQISGIPHTVLVDKNRKIVAKNLRGEALEAKLSQLFAQ